MTPRYLVNFDSDKLEKSICDLLVIGSGIAGLTAALQACGKYRTLLLTKSEVKESTTWYAQGGVATAVGEHDSPQLHFEDTILAGDGLCDPQAVKILVTEGPGRITDLIHLGAEFDRLGEEMRLTREGGHSLPRILHAGDATGSAIESTLVRVAKLCSGLQIKEHVFVVDLLDFDGRCIGAIIFEPSLGRFSICLAKAVILATGGAGQIYSVTTNPPISTGDGVAMAYRAGAEMMDMEFVQFHPTALDEAQNPRFLITEALRGEGAYLRDCKGNRFMAQVHPEAELAPRNVVVREMVKVMHDCKTDRVYLDATHIPLLKLKERFPTIWKRCQESGYDLSTDLIPVSPAAHFMIGGVKTDIYGRTSLSGLYASGEVAANGVHGANRLASNSLLEGLVFSKRIMDILEEKANEISQEDLLGIRMTYTYPRRPKDVKIEECRNLIQKTMMEDAGVTRSVVSLKRALKVMDSLKDILNMEFSLVEGFELQNMIMVAELICRSALMREESRGVHFREDFPQKDDAGWKKHIILKINHCHPR